MYIDIHTHLDHDNFNTDRDEVVKRARDAGVKLIINNGVNPVTNRLTLEYAKKYDIVEAALGIYPVEALSKEIEQMGISNWLVKPFDMGEELTFIEHQAKTKKIVAFGEVGLDFHSVGRETENSQKSVFQRFIDLSEKYKLPLIIHSRKAEQDVFDMLQSSNARKAVFHCFTGRVSLAKKIIDKGYSFSIPPLVVRNQQFQGLVQEIPTSRILTETDAPYLGPDPGKRNEPMNVISSVDIIAKLKKVEPEEMKKMIYMNYKNLF